MSIRIDHGPNGSYKTSGIIEDMFIPSVLAGRYIVTNIRGIKSREELIDVIGSYYDKEIPSTFDILHLPTTDCDNASKNREYLARFFHWLPFGALLIVDEAQMVFPKSWRDSDIQLLDYPGGSEQADKDKRPKDFLTAWDMHRHYNWDICLTTTNIKKIRDDIRFCADMAYRHRDMALIGFTGRYFETKHQPEDLGSAESDQISTRTRKVISLVWKLYESTSTGTHQKSINSHLFLKNPKMVLLLLVLAYLLYGVFTSDSPLSNAKKSVLPVDSTSKAVASDTTKNIPLDNKNQIDKRTSNDVDFVQAREVDTVVEPFKFYHIRLSSYSAVKVNKSTEYNYYFELTSKQDIQRMKGNDLVANGYDIQFISPCLVKITYNKTVRIVTCTKPIINRNQMGLPRVNPVESIQEIKPPSQKVASHDTPNLDFSLAPSDSVQ